MSLNSAYSGKKVIITGHTGFKGSWLARWLSLMGAEIFGISRDIPTTPSHFAAAQLSSHINDHRFDISDLDALKAIFKDVQPDYVFHLAAQPLVWESYDKPVETWNTNLLGTLNVLEALRRVDNSCSAVMVTSDKCYQNKEWTWGYRETDRLGGVDPYSASKAAAEIAIQSYIKSFFSPSDSSVRIASARAGNVIGGGDWASNRIIPDCVRSWSNNQAVTLRSPFATRPWQHVLEPISGYLYLAASLAQSPIHHGESFNFGPRDPLSRSVLDLVKEMALHWKLVSWEDFNGSEALPHEAGLLKLACDKALTQLHWHSILTFSETVEMTATWYKCFYDDPNISPSVTEDQIAKYSDLLDSRILM